ncbi:MAG: hypothetical protein PHX86_02715 [Caldisericia bacterium]|nr:hypothetical protein [Caldisericia bacterium]
MRNRIIVFAIVLFVCLTGFGRVFSSDEQNPPEIEIYSHPGVELVNVVAFLSTIDQYSNCQLLTSVFLYQAKKFFAPWKDHPVVQQYVILKDNEGIDEVYQIMLEGEPWEEQAAKLEIEDEDKEQIVLFVETLQDFAKVSHFSQYMTTMKHPYSQIASSFQYTEHIQEELRTAQNFFGYNFHKVHVLLCPTQLYAMNSFVTINHASQKRDLFILASLSDVQNGYLQFGTKSSFSSLLSDTVPIFLFQQAMDHYGIRMNEFQSKTNQLFFHQLLEALRIVVYKDTYTKIPVDDFLHQCTEKGKTFVSPIYSIIDKEYTSSREEYVHFIAYTPHFYNSLMVLFNGGDV